MTLSEIETILEELVVRHQNLNKELLTTLLLSAGWDDRNIKDALMLFKQRDTKKQPLVASSSQPVVKVVPPPAPPVAQMKKEDMTFLQSDGTVEKEIGVFVETEDVPVVRTIKKEPDLLTKIASSLPDALNIEIASDTKTPIEIKKADSPIVKEEDNVPLTRRPQPEKINVAKSSSNNEEGNVVTSLFGIKFVDDTKKPVEVKKPLSATEIRKEETPVKAKEKITFDRGVAEKGDDSLVTSIFGITFVNDTPKVAEVKEVLKTEERKSNKELVTPHKAEITFAPVSEALSKSDETSPLQDQAAKSSPVSIPLSAPIFLEPETHSLMKSESSLPEKKKTKEADIPLELPLLPFESSPHVWSFSHYKNTFHGDDKNSEPKKEPAPPEKKEALFYPVESKPVAAPTLSSTNNVEDEEVSLEKTPLTRGDESLVFLASVMLLVIILILGYMYGKGRL